MNQNHLSPATGYPCLECSGSTPKFPTAEELEIHIASDHLNYCPYECERCRFAKFPTEYALISHCKNDHELKEFFVRYRFTLEGERKSLELKSKMRACLRQRAIYEDHLGLGTSNGHSQLFHGSGEKYEDTDSFPSSVEPSVSSSEHPAVIHSGSSASSAASSASGVVPPATSPATVPVTPTSLMPNVHRNITNSGGNFLQQNSMSYTGSMDTTQQLHLSQNHLSTNYGSNFPSNSNPPASAALAELSPMDFASDAMSSGMDFAALIGEGEELIRKPKDAVICQICGLKVSNQRSSLVYHANTKHIKLNLYQCAVCQKTWQTIAKSDVLKHVKAIHNGDENMIIDNRKRLGYQLRMFTARCFPPKQNNKARPLTAGCSPPRPGGIPPSDGDYNNMHSESTSQILQSFIVSGNSAANNTPKEEPDMDHDEAEHEDGCDGLDEVDHGYGDGRTMQAALACMVAQQQQHQQQQQQQLQQQQQQQQHNNNNNNNNNNSSSINSNKW
ncbi:hypothetical protein KIN20_017823 [Parelaphostrongylus tenuis]|uniref:C2H2-type domain-containing protein n=1 Tax=Parelaphostrongylus tenuis TaxID=148309 RepID=A0AAD5N0E0_PARTN|nr:hypothetical protein KIN20_017823 [Parelaphostrongylus tenuis]